MTNPKIGFIGLGRMGVIMARHLVEAGHELIVHNRTRSVAETFTAEVGGRPAHSPAEVAGEADIIILMLADGPAVLEVIDGDQGLTAALQPGATVVDMGTTGQAHTDEARRLLEAHGGNLVEAPVSGSTAAAEAQTLLIMASGRDEDVERATPILEALSPTVVRVGGAGAGAAMKLAVNSVLYAINGAIAESLVLAERAGVPRATAYDVFARSAVAAPVVHYRRPVFEAPETTPVTFAIDLANKDLGLILDLAAAVGADMPQAEANREIMQQAATTGMGAADMGEIATFLRKGRPTQD